MRNKLLFSTVALLAGVTLASAQQGGAPGGQPGGMERQSPPQTQRAPEGRGKEQQGQQSQPQRGKDQTTGQAPGQMQREEGKDQKREEGKDQKGQPPRAKDQRAKDKDQTTGQAPGQMQRDQGKDQQGQPQRDQQRPEGTPKQSQPQREQGQQGQQGAQQQGGGASLTAEQRTKIRQQVLVSGAPRVTNVNFSVSVGTVVPQHVRVVPVPDVIVEVHPQWRGFLYFVVEERIIIVDSNHRIVAILVV